MSKKSNSFIWGLFQLKSRFNFCAACQALACINRGKRVAELDSGIGRQSTEALPGQADSEEMSAGSQCPALHRTHTSPAGRAAHLAQGALAAAPTTLCLTCTLTPHLVLTRRPHAGKAKQTS